MRKKTLLILSCIIVFLLSLLCLAGCGAPQEKENSGIIEEETGSGFRVSKVPIILQDGWVPGDVALNGKTAFYVSALEQEMGVNMIKASITAVDLDSSHSETIFQHENEEGFYINEMRASPDRLFWVLSENETVSVQQMDLSTGEIKDIEAYDDKQKDILLQTDGSYLTWIMQTGEDSTIRVYDIKEDRVFDLTKEADIAFPYARANLSDGICSFPTAENGVTVINIYDLANQQMLHQFEIGEGAEVFNVTADKERCVYSIFQGEEIDPRLFVRDYDNPDPQVLNESEEWYIFSWMYSSGNLFINDRNASSIIAHDCQRGDDEMLLDQEEHLLILDGMTPEKDYYVMDVIDDTEPVLYIIKQTH